MKFSFGAGSHKLRSEAFLGATLGAAVLLSLMAPEAMAQATGIGGSGSSMAIPTDGQSIGGLTGNWIASTCAYFGLLSKKRQQFHYLDDDHDNLSLGNLVCACPLFHEIHHLGPAVVRRSGALIFLSEMSQVELNSMCQAIFVAIHTQGVGDKDARGLYEALKSRAAVLEAKLGSAATNPGALGAVLLRMKPSDYAQREAFVGPIRFLPKMTSFADDVAYWASAKGPIGRYPAQKWKRYAIPEVRQTAGLAADPLLQTMVSSHGAASSSTAG